MWALSTSMRATPASKVVYPVKFAKGGKYEVRISFAHHPSRSTKTLVTVRHNDGEKAFRINQKKEPAVDGCFQSLGFFEFQAGQWDAVEISAKGRRWGGGCRCGSIFARRHKVIEGKEEVGGPKGIAPRPSMTWIDGRLEARHVPHIAWLLKHGKVKLPEASC